MTDENRANELPELQMKLEPADGTETLGESKRLRLAVEGEPDTIRLLAEIVLQLVGGEVYKAVTVGPDGETDVTADFARSQSSSQIDILDTGDLSE